MGQPPAANRRLMRMGRRPKIALFAIFGIVAGVVLLEVLLRAVSYIPMSSPAYIYDPDVDFRLRPRVGTDEGGFNNLRDRDSPAPPTKTLMFVGDSFTFGTYPAPDVFPAMVGDLLRGDSHDIAALNLGVPGTGPRTYVKIIRRYVPVHRPAVVVVTLFLGNDVGESHPDRQIRLWLGQPGNLVNPLRIGAGGAFFMVTSVADKLFRMAELWWFTITRPAPRLSEDPLEANRRSPTFPRASMLRIEHRQLAASRRRPSAFIRDGFDGLYVKITEMAAECRRHDATLFIVLAPSEAQVNPDLRRRVAMAFGVSEQAYDPARPIRLIARLLSEQRIGFVDLLPVFAGQDGVRLYNRLDPHWNRRGNAVAAQAIAAALAPLLEGAQ